MEKNTQRGTECSVLLAQHFAGVKIENDMGGERRVRGFGGET